MTNADLTAHVDAGASSDPDGTITSYSWNFGDGSNAGTGQVTDHTYSQSGTYTITLTVTDNAGATATTQHDVTVTAPPVSSVVVPDTSTWSWKYDATAPPASWNTVGFNAATWKTGTAVLGFGDPSVQTNIDTFATTAQRPAAAYFVRNFQVDDKSKVTQLVLNTVADDGIVVYVNGTEVNRTNMPPGPGHQHDVRLGRGPHGQDHAARDHGADEPARQRDERDRGGDAPQLPRDAGPDLPSEGHADHPRLTVVVRRRRPELGPASSRHPRRGERTRCDGIII